MLVRIENSARQYAWGSETLLADLQGREPSGQPEAEIWFGTHPVSPARVSETGEALSELIEPLPFLVKFLAAAEPLSIQAHPDRARAEKRFAEENAAGIALDDPARLYRDANHKPELLVAITDFAALCGFRPIAEAVDEIESLAIAAPELEELVRALEGGGYKAAVEWAFAHPELTDRLDASRCLSRRRARLIEELCERYPADAGVLVSLLLNLVQLAPGEAIYLPAGNPHSYLQGLGVEVMAASDNVLRGGLTKKHVAVKELLAVLDYRELHDAKLAPRELSAGIAELISTEDFQVYELKPSATNLIADLELRAAAIVVCTAGTISISTSLDQLLEISQGEAAYLGGEARLFSVAGSGTGYLAMN